MEPLDFNFVIELEEVNDDEWMNEKLYDDCEISLGKTVHLILKHFVDNKQTKKSLNDLLELLQILLPKPNYLPKTIHHLYKMINKILHVKKDGEIIKKHRICESCSNYLGIWKRSKNVKFCSDCNSTKIDGLFVEYDLKCVLKDALVHRELYTLLETHCKNDDSLQELDKDSIFDLSSADIYKMLKSNEIKNDHDICLLWNSDGFPVANGSAAQMWLTQVKIVNIPVAYRKNFQFVTGIYHSAEKKPDMTAFLRPFVDKLRELYKGIEWLDKRNSEIKCSKVIAPVSTLDAPAKATTLNMMHFMGEYGCPFCEHPGFSCNKGEGHNRIFPETDTRYLNRTKESMLIQAAEATNNNFEHVMGIKGPSIASLIPCFNIPSSCPSDYLHAKLLGLQRALMFLWFDSQNHKEPYYVKKSLKNEINLELLKIYPPDTISRTPRTIKHIKHLKGTELEDFLIYYLPILLKDRLPKKYYDHFLLFSYATAILLQGKISMTAIDHAEYLFQEFAKGMETNYGLENCSWNMHQCTHSSESVRLWGPLWSWSTFSFENNNGRIKNIIHGSRRMDVEIANSLKIYNCSLILKSKYENNNSEKKVITFGSPLKNCLNDEELEFVKKFCNAKSICLDSTTFYNKAKFKNRIYTSVAYSLQKKRINYEIFWEKKLGKILCFLCENNNTYAVIRELQDVNNGVNIVPNPKIRFPHFHTLVRDSYCMSVIPVTSIEGKLIRINNYVARTFSRNDKN